MAPKHQTTFRLTELDLRILNTAVKELDLGSRTEALRYILRDWAKTSHNVEPPKPF